MAWLTKMSPSYHITRYFSNVVKATAAALPGLLFQSKCSAVLTLKFHLSKSKVNTNDSGGVQESTFLHRKVDYITLFEVHAPLVVERGAVHTDGGSAVCDGDPHGGTQTGVVPNQPTKQKNESQNGGVGVLYLASRTSFQCANHQRLEGESKRIIESEIEGSADESISAQVGERFHRSRSVLLLKRCLHDFRFAVLTFRRLRNDFYSCRRKFKEASPPSTMPRENFVRQKW